MRLFRPIFERSLTRRAISAVTLVAYLALVFGFPMPVVAARKGGQPFPCQNSPCGCATAEQCWTSCCCTTPEQRFTWAARNGVTPPAYATPPRSSGWQETPKKSCCSTPAKPRSCCEGGDAPSCEPEKKPETTSPENEPTNDEDAPTEVRFVLGIAAQKCRGLSQTWMTAGLAPVPPAWIDWLPNDRPLEWLPIESNKALSLSHVPLAPPPRD